MMILKQAVPNAVGAQEKRVVDILVVDDKRDTREALLAFLELEGFATRFAEDGLQALGKVMEHVPDLICLDANMPDMDGFEMLETLRSDPATRNIPVIGHHARHLGRRARVSPGCDRLPDQACADGDVPGADLSAHPGAGGGTARGRQLRRWLAGNVILSTSETARADPPRRR
jgi:CheY-like chemotaxis protein